MSDIITAGAIHQWDAFATRGDFPIQVGDKLLVCVLLDPMNPTSEILLQLRARGSYDHRALWGTATKVTHMDPSLV